MSERGYAVDTDLKEAQAMVDALEPYVLEEELYGQIGGMFSRSKMPALTIGALLMRIRRLRALADQLTLAQQQKLDAIEAKNTAVRQQWRLHYDQKAVREALSRLDVIKHCLDECSHDPKQCAYAYLPEANRRTIAQEIVLSLEGSYADTSALPEKVRNTDARLRRYSQPTDFIWDPVLEPVYPRNQFAWLYARPPLPTKD